MKIKWDYNRIEINKKRLKFYYLEVIKFYCAYIKQGFQQMKNLFFVLLRSIWFLTSAHRSVFAMQNKKLFHDCLFFFQLVSKSTVIPNSNHLPNVCIVSYQKIWNKINLILYTNFFISALIVPWNWNFLPFQEINRQTD